MAYFTACYWISTDPPIFLVHFDVVRSFDMLQHRKLIHVFDALLLKNVSLSLVHNRTASQSPLRIVNERSSFWSKQKDDRGILNVLSSLVTSHLFSKNEIQLFMAKDSKKTTQKKRKHTLDNLTFTSKATVVFALLPNTERWNFFNHLSENNAYF